MWCTHCGGRYPPIGDLIRGRRKTGELNRFGGAVVSVRGWGNSALRATFRGQTVRRLVCHSDNDSFFSRGVRSRNRVGEALHSVVGTPFGVTPDCSVLHRTWGFLDHRVVDTDRPCPEVTVGAAVPSSLVCGAPRRATRKNMERSVRNPPNSPLKLTGARSTAIADRPSTARASGSPRRPSAGRTLRSAGWC